MLSDIKYYVEDCKKYLENKNAYGTALETYLTRFLLVYICAQYEIEIKEIVRGFIAKKRCTDLESLIVNRLLIRDIKTSALCGSILKKISDKHGESFKNQVNNSDAERHYHNIIQNRNDVAHAGRTNMSFNELYTTYESAAQVLVIFSNALNS